MLVAFNHSCVKLPLHSTVFMKQWTNVESWLQASSRLDNFSVIFPAERNLPTKVNYRCFARSWARDRNQLKYRTRLWIALFMLSWAPCFNSTRTVVRVLKKNWGEETGCLTCYSVGSVGRVLYQLPTDSVKENEPNLQSNSWDCDINPVFWERWSIGASPEVVHTSSVEV